MIPTLIVNLFILYLIVYDTEAIVTEESFLESLGLLNGIGLSSVCKYTLIPLSFLRRFAPLSTDGGPILLSGFF